MRQDKVQQEKITLVTYLNPDYTDEQIKHMVIDQWHLWLALNPNVDTHRFNVAELAVKEEPRRVTYFRQWLQAEGYI